MRKVITKISGALGIRRILYEIEKWIEVYYFYIKNLFNLHVIKQGINYKSIPIIIISFNQLFYLKQLVGFLQKHNYNNIIIIDNNSTYKPLLNYFESIGSSVTLHKLKENHGHLVFWEKKELFEKYSKGYYIVTDADIVPEPNCPSDFVSYFKKILNRNPKITKVGFSLKIDDIPETNPNKEKVIKWESRFWNNKDKEGNYKADIDTTLALYRPGYSYKEQDFYKAIRTKKPYLAKHGGWYLDINNLTEEQRFYYSTCNQSSSWRLDKGKNLETNLYD
ncbi:MAG: glycosyltransferase family 2 protein [Bacteroidota bacterium]